MCFAGRVYTEVTPTDMLIDVALERSVFNVTSDFHCEWAIVAIQTMAPMDETFFAMGQPLSL